MGDFNLPQLGAWEVVKVDLLCQRAERREAQEAEQGHQTKSGMIWLELVEEYGLHQMINENIRKENILDLFWTNSACPRRARVVNNVLLTDHNTSLWTSPSPKKKERGQKSPTHIVQKSASMTRA